MHRLQVKTDTAIQPYHIDYQNDKKLCFNRGILVRATHQRSSRPVNPCGFFK